MKTLRRHELNDDQWSRLEPLLPKAQRGRQARNLRMIVNGIVWLDKTGAPWRDLPERYGPWRTVASQFYRWVRAGVWEQILAQVQQQADQQGQVDWQVHYVDGSVIRAHQHAAGARRVKGGGTASARAQPGRLLDQAPPARRGRRQADGARADGGRAP